ncbi:MULTISPECIES: CBM9 family sugar-binding protein [unclassified Pseudoalteromonas]|uniref:CBM9 family sugar-binding protein n=1 Tax=unclassified Pseudoalteromonas TaxID=194690 RepID=UPI000C07E094|nr:MULTISPECIES: CBM9 family sugar-binding protein [unclassified Pseudoalteromonas]MDP2636296.1 CBM9 family sugar-binding protein [Pseudoalteromonas sp. 1_MG-2023]PHN90370.1 sugar-binding protein [Pseudoalteromonas sp. 3D05]
MKKSALISSLLVCNAAFAIDVEHTSTPITIDGVAESAWDKATWQTMPHLMDGTLPDSSKDFKGRYKLLWDEGYLYLQADIADDVLIDTHPDPTEKYWDDDALEIFIDSDASGGKHQFNHTAFAYHIGLDNQAADFGPDKKPHLYTDHLVSRWQRNTNAPYNITWEVAIKLYPNDYQEGTQNTPLKLTPKQVVGFMLAYCDNDGSKVREHFMGSHDVQPVNGSRNLGYIDADVFGKITLLPKK